MLNVCWANLQFWDANADAAAPVAVGAEENEELAGPGEPLGQLTLTSGSSVLLRCTSCCCTSRRLARLPSSWWCDGGGGGGGSTTTTASAGVGSGSGSGRVVPEWVGAPGGRTVAAAATAARVVAEPGECDTLYIKLPMFGWCWAIWGGGGAGGSIISSIVQTRSSTGKVKLISLPFSSAETPA